jgi:hypothetical protein
MSAGKPLIFEYACTPRVSRIGLQGMCGARGLGGGNRERWL